MPEMIDRQDALSVCKDYGWIDDEDFLLMGIMQL